MNKFKKITVAALATAILAVAAPMTGVLPDVMSTTASASYTYDENGLYIVDGVYDLINSGEKKNGVLMAVNPDVTSIVIPDRVTTVFGLNFTDCSKLTSISVSDGNQYFSSENGVMFNKDKTQLVRYPTGKKDTLYTIPDGVTEVLDFAFSGSSNLTGVVIPQSVTAIATESRGGAFAGSGLKTVYGVPGSYAETYAKQLGYEFKDTSEASDHGKTAYASTTDVPGDVDGDGKSTVSDATAVLKYVAGLAKFEGNSMKNALLTGGEKPSVKDATQILKMVAGLA